MVMRVRHQKLGQVTSSCALTSRLVAFPIKQLPRCWLGCPVAGFARQVMETLIMVDEQAWLGPHHGRG